MEVVVSHEIEIVLPFLLGLTGCRILVHEDCLQRIPIGSEKPLSLSAREAHRAFILSTWLIFLLQEVREVVSLFLGLRVARAILLKFAVSLKERAAHIKKHGGLLEGMREGSCLVCGFCEYLLCHIVLYKHRFSVIKARLIFLAYIYDLFREDLLIAHHHIIKPMNSLLLILSNFGPLISLIWAIRDILALLRVTWML